MKRYIIIVFAALISCQPEEYHEMKSDSNTAFDRAKLVYPQNYHQIANKSPIYYLEKLTIPSHLHNDTDIIILTCELISEVNADTYSVHGQTYALDVNIDVVKIIKNSYRNEIPQPSSELVFLKDLADAAKAIQKISQSSHRTTEF